MRIKSYPVGFGPVVGDIFPENQADFHNFKLNPLEKEPKKHGNSLAR